MKNSTYVLVMFMVATVFSSACAPDRKRAKLRSGSKVMLHNTSDADPLNRPKTEESKDAIHSDGSSALQATIDSTKTTLTLTGGDARALFSQLIFDNTVESTERKKGQSKAGQVRDGIDVSCRSKAKVDENLNSKKEKAAAITQYDCLFEIENIKTGKIRSAKLDATIYNTMAGPIRSAEKPSFMERKYEGDFLVVFKDTSAVLAFGKDAAEDLFKSMSMPEVSQTEFVSKTMGTLQDISVKKTDGILCGIEKKPGAKHFCEISFNSGIGLIIDSPVPDP